MPIKVYKPTTPARRRTSVVSFSDLTKGKKREKSLTKKLKKYSGRNNQGRITVRHRGGGAKKIYRMVDFKRQKFDAPAVVQSIEYDPNRNARIALIKYKKTEQNGSTQEHGANNLSYILASIGMKVGDEVMSSAKKIEIKNGNRMPLELIPQGSMVYNVEIESGKGGKMARGAGTSIILQNIEGKYAQLKMPSGEIKLFRKECFATIGQVSNSEAKLIRIGKAGRKRHMGIRPTVRGKAMNPVDHPHGGGEGRHPIGMKHPKTKWGKPALGVKTRKPKWTDKLIIKKRKKHKKK
ncbi:50S ribosomal protein L2 [Candidatus Parcubacteria bacterium]|nr:50S ribosomal protein L2 [Patescibacteria group bacterium]MCG2686938.1 50S ribosomal protein L2 [Candidatus Parcubacteria bacterium]